MPPIFPTTSNKIPGQDIWDNFNLDDAYVKPKHISTTGGNGAKFIGDKEYSTQILKKAMENGKIVEINPNGISAQGFNKYEYILDAGEIIGTKGETFIKIVLSEDGGMLSAYPIKR